LVNFKHPNNEIQDEAVKSFESFCKSYYGEDASIDSSNLIVAHVSKLFEPSKNDQNIAVTRGYNMAFGVLSTKLLEHFNPEVLEVLMANCVPKGRESDDAETRKQAIHSLIAVVEKLGLKQISLEVRGKVLDTLYKCYDDYAVDRRGDVGSWVRQEAMSALHKYINLIVTSEDSQILKDMGAD
jgi:tubulin-specific chaperone D